MRQPAWPNRHGGVSTPFTLRHILPKIVSFTFWLGAMFLELVKGAALLLALCFLHGANMRLWRRHPRGSQVMSGLLFGGICVVGMLSPVTLQPGIIADARCALFSINPRV